MPGKSNTHLFSVQTQHNPSFFILINLLLSEEYSIKALFKSFKGVNLQLPH